MILESKVGRNARQCVTCQYWTGQSARADSPNFIVCDLKERAICNKEVLKKQHGSLAVITKKDIIFNK